MSVGRKVQTFRGLSGPRPIASEGGADRLSYYAEFGRSRLNGTSVIKEIRLKKINPSRSLNVSGTDTD